MFICRFDHDSVRYYFNYSTVVNAPTTWAMTREEYETYYRRKFGPDGMRGLPDRLARADESGSSATKGVDFERMIAGNLAGPDKEKLNRDEMIALVMKRRADKAHAAQAVAVK
jgi:hypothetical protein